MDELINLVSQRAGLSQEQARAAVTTVLDFLKQKLPAPIAGQIDGLLAGGGALGNLGDVTKGLGGLFGKK
jgi:hypothetical protein